MKKKIIYVVPFALLMFSCGGESTPADGNTNGPSPMSKPGVSASAKPDNALFEIKSAKITYDYKSMSESGVDVFWFDDYGNTAVLEMDRKGQYDAIKKVFVWKDKSGFFVDHIKKNAPKVFFRSKDTEPSTLATQSAEMRKKEGYEKLADETIAGKTCEVWKNSKINTTYWIWNKVTLKEDLMGSIVRTATAVEENVTIPSNLLAVPEGYKQ